MIFYVLVSMSFSRKRLHVEEKKKERVNRKRKRRSRRKKEAFEFHIPYSSSFVCSRKPAWDYQWIPRSSLISFYAFDQLCRHLYLPLLRKRPLPQQLFPAQQGSVSLGWLATFASKSPMKSGAFDKPICIQRTWLVHTLKIDGGCFFFFFPLLFLMMRFPFTWLTPL